MTSWAVARLFAMSTYDFARDFASESLTEASAGLSLSPELTKPFALAAYTFGWLRLNTAAAAIAASVMNATPAQCARRTRR